MKEQVIFHEPQNVTILATREGKLTQIPGSEFRAPIAPHIANISAEWGDLTSTPQEAKLRIYHDTYTTVKVLGLFQQDRYGTYRVALPDESKTHTNVKMNDNHLEKLVTWVYWKPSFLRDDKPEDNLDLMTLVEITSYNTLENLNEDGSVLLPECYGTTAFIIRENPNYPSDYWKW